MGDFFHRLAERTLGMAPLVQPLIAPMYAPGPELPHDVMQNPLEEDMQEVSPEETMSEVQRTPRVQKAVSLAVPPSPLLVPRDAVGATLQDRRPTSHVSHPSLPEDTSPEPDRARRTELEHAPIIHDEPSTTAPFGQNKRGLRLVTNKSLAPADTAWKPLVPSSTTQAPPLSRLAGEPRSRTSNPPDRHTPLVIKPLVALAPEPTVRFPERRSDRLENMTPSSPPTIRVTIGRVDVRAIMPPPAPVRQAKPAAPKVSLDDYLRTRRGGQR